MKAKLNIISISNFIKSVLKYGFWNGNMKYYKNQYYLSLRVVVSIVFRNCWAFSIALLVFYKTEISLFYLESA